MKRIGVLTSGGDSSGMNAAIRAVVRSGIEMGLEVYGFIQGYAGVLDRNYRIMDSSSVSGIINRGGTILKSARCEEFKTDRGQEEGHRALEELGIEGLVVIGGDGSLRGANALNELGVKVTGIPATIDNDVYGTDMAIGVDTCLNTITWAIDTIKDTASSHERAFIIEVMGRESGYLAIMSSLSCGAEAALIPEFPYDLEKIGEKLAQRFKEGKTDSIILVAEGASSAYTIQRKLKNHIGFETRISVLGHIQRGGVTSVFDRTLASRLGVEAVQALKEGKTGIMIGLSKGKFIEVPFQDVMEKKKGIDPKLFELARILGVIL
jgi:6-phosphofructokinase 1